MVIFFSDINLPIGCSLEFSIRNFSQPVYLPWAAINDLPTVPHQSSFLALTIVSTAAVLPFVMLILESLPGSGCLGIDSVREIGGTSHGFQNYRIVGRRGSIRPPGKWAMIGNQHPRHRRIIQVLESLDNRIAGILFVLRRDSFVRHSLRDWNWPVEIISVGGSKTRNRLTRLRPRGRVLGMGMGHTAYFRERLIEH